MNCTTCRRGRAALVILRNHIDNYKTETAKAGSMKRLVLSVKLEGHMLAYGLLTKILGVEEATNAPGNDSQDPS